MKNTRVKASVEEFATREAAKAAGEKWLATKADRHRWGHSIRTRLGNNDNGTTRGRFCYEVYFDRHVFLTEKYGPIGR